MRTRRTSETIRITTRIGTRDMEEDTPSGGFEGESTDPPDSEKEGYI